MFRSPITHKRCIKTTIQFSLVMSFYVCIGILVGCTDNSSDQIAGLERLQKSTQENLMTCQQQLEYYRQIGGSSSQSKELQRSEPQYETVNAYHITTKLGSTVCYMRNNADGDQESEDLACGMTFSECKDGYIYRCMVDVKYKIVEEKRLIEEE